MAPTTCNRCDTEQLQFTTLGTTGRDGPTSTAGYAGMALEGMVTLDGGIQHWTVPATGLYRIEAAGAQGGNAIADVVFGAYGARFLRHEFALQDAIGSHACSLQPARFKRAGVRPMAFLSVVHFSYQLTL